MYSHITVVPYDSVIIVDGEAIQFPFAAPDGMHALQWHEGAGHIEYTDDRPNRAVTTDDYASEVLPFTTLWESEKSRRAEEANRPPTLKEAREAKLAAIDNETSAAICAGFLYAVDGASYHFSYDTFDQQNFADTANAAILATISGDTAQNVLWNGWQDKTTTNKGTLHRLTFTPTTFLALYTQGALVHKAATMMTGGARKEAAMIAETISQLEGI